MKVFLLLFIWNHRSPQVVEKKEIKIRLRDLINISLKSTFGFNLPTNFAVRAVTRLSKVPLNVNSIELDCILKTFYAFRTSKYNDSKNIGKIAVRRILRNINQYRNKSSFRRSKVIDEIPISKT